MNIPVVISLITLFALSSCQKPQNVQGLVDSELLDVKNSILLASSKYNMTFKEGVYTLESFVLNMRRQSDDEFIDNIFQFITYKESGYTDPVGNSYIVTIKDDNKNEKLMRCSVIFTGLNGVIDQGDSDDVTLDFLIQAKADKSDQP